VNDVHRIAPEGKEQIIAKAQGYADKPERVRFQMVTALIAESQSFGYEIKMEIFEAAGYGSANEYWRVAMSEPMSASKFVHLLVWHQIDPRRNNETYWLRQRIAEALKKAAEARESWLVFNGDITWVKNDKDGTGWHVPEKLTVRDPNEAAKWMLGVLRLQPLIPPGLVDFIKGKQPQKAKSPAKKTVNISGLMAFFLKSLEAEPDLTMRKAEQMARQQFDKVGRAQIRADFRKAQDKLQIAPGKTGPRGPRNPSPIKSLN
jgi:hypothetical protein